MQSAIQVATSLRPETLLHRVPFGPGTIDHHSGVRIWEPAACHLANMPAVYHLPPSYELYLSLAPTRAARPVPESLLSINSCFVMYLCT